MDEKTQAVRAFYEQYPYPAGGVEMRVGFDARLLLSYGSRVRAATSPIRVLDAGCGRAVGLIASAMLQPDIDFLGIDMNRTALHEAEQEATRRRVENVRFLEVDLMTLDGLAVPPGGFDVVHSSGVVHHLTDPVHGLRLLQSVLAPHGVLPLMVYSRAGREPIHVVARAIDAIIPRSAPLAARLEAGRALVHTLALASPGSGPWAAAANTNDVEFVDRYLHIQETSYDVDGLFELIDAAGLAFLRWSNERQWSLESACPEVLSSVCRAGLSPRDEFRLVDQIRRPSRLEAYLCQPGNDSRPELTATDLGDATLAVSPEIVFELSTRTVNTGIRNERLAFRRPDEPPIGLSAGPLATAGLILRDQIGSFRGAALIAALVGEGATRADATTAVLQLLRHDVLYARHEVDA